MYPAKYNQRRFYLLCVCILLPLAISVPVPPSKTFYQAFIDSLLAEKCEMPKNVKVPFPDSTQLTNFSFLSSPLSECQNPEALNPESETHFLCQETFNTLHYIACSAPMVPLPEIKSSLDFGHVCEEFAKMKEDIPKSKDNLSSRLVDDLICKLLCKDKFKVMCQTLLWSYDIQRQIKKVVQNANAQDQVGVSETVGTNTENIVQEPVFGKQNLKVQNDANVNNNGGVDQNAKTEQNNFPGKNNIVPEDQVKDNKTENSIGKNQSETENIPDMPELPNIFQSRIVLPLINNTAVNQFEDKGNLTATNPGIENRTAALIEEAKTIVAEKDEKSELAKDKKPDQKPKPAKDEIKLESVKAEDRKPETVQDVEKITKPVTISEKSTSTSDVTSEDTTNVKNTPSSNKEVSTDSKVSKQVEENELDGANFDEEKPKGSDVENNIPIPEGAKDSEKQVEGVLSTSEKISVDATSKSTSTIIEVVPDRNLDEDPDDREPEQDYNDTENEDYPKLEYENSLNELKARKPVEKSSVASEVVKPNIDIQDNYDMLLTRNNFGRGQADTPMIASFPEQEDSHFFFYFLSIVLILMAGYLLVHNKQKIIALIIEGRHERRRRSHGAAYKKLDTK